MLHSMSACYTQWGLVHFTIGKFDLKKESKPILNPNDIHDEELRNEVSKGSKYMIDSYVQMNRCIIKQI